MEDKPQQSSEPIINIMGEKVALGPRTHDMLPTFERWVNDFEVTRGIGLIPPQNHEQEEAWYERSSKSETDVMFAVYERSTMRLIGATGLHGIDHLNGTAEFGIMIGDKESWGKGYGTEVARLMLDYGFTALGLHNIWLRVFSYNEGGIRAYKKAGFREIGRRREAKRTGGRFWDVIMMDCLASEFESPVLAKVLRDG